DGRLPHLCRRRRKCIGAAVGRDRLHADAAIRVSYRDETGTKTMTETVANDRPPVAKPISRPRSRKPATVSASALALHLDCSRTYIGKLEAEGVIQRQGDGFPLDQSRVTYLRYLRRDLQRSMMGRLKGDQGQLFYEFHLGDAVPEDHLVRKIDTALDLSWLRGELAPHYSSMGRPSIDPELMIRMMVVGYVFAIRSEGLICREVQVNLAYRWFCKLGIEEAIPDHSAFSRARNERFREGDVFRRVFERVVEACLVAGLVGGESLAVDASLIQADANKQRSIAGQDWRRDRDP